MDIKAGLYSYLTSKALLTALVGSRIYPDVAPQGATIPYLTFIVADSIPTKHLQGASALADDMVTIKIHASTSEERDSVKEALRNILHTRRNTTLTPASGNIDMRSCTLEHIHDNYSSPQDGSETGGAFQAEMDFSIKFVEAVPTLP